MGESQAIREQSALEKQQRLLERLGQLESLLVALSGGADSAYLAWVAHRALGTRMLAQLGLPHEFIETRELANPAYVANRGDRCYHCKSELFACMERLAAARGFAALAYGINADDTGDFRPGHRAAAEHGVLAPLLEVGLHKAEIRWLSRQAGLPTWDRPASACLASRVAYGLPVTPEVLARIERGEAALRALGFCQFRLRDHGQLARIEIGADELPRALDAAMAARMVAALKPLGYLWVTLDLEGYRQGSLNQLLAARRT